MTETLAMFFIIFMNCFMINLVLGKLFCGEPWSEMFKGMKFIISAALFFSALVFVGIHV